MRQRKALDDPTAGPLQRRISLRDVLTAVGNLKLWLHILLTTVGLAPSTALWSYAPTIVASFGYIPLSSNAMTSVGQWISVTLVVLGGFVADKWGRRGYFVLLAVTIEFVFTVAYKCLPDDTNRGTKYAMLTLASATCSWWRMFLFPNNYEHYFVCYNFPFSNWCRFRQRFLDCNQRQDTRRAVHPHGESLP